MQRRDYLIFGLLVIISLIVSYFTATVGYFFGIVLIFILAALAVFVVIINNFRIGFYILLTYSFFLFYIGRILGVVLPYGILVDVFYLLIFLSILVHKYRNPDELEGNVFKNPIGFGILLFICFGFLELLNPNSASISGKLTGFRESLSILISFYVVMNVFTSKNDVRFFTKFWLAIALLAALYGMHQEHVGFTSFEIRSASANGGLKPIWGRIRKWSFLSDVSAFGLFMSYSATICFILSLGPFKIRDRIILVVSGILMYVSMTYSGTRTAFATLFLGLAFYVFLSLNNRKTLIFASLFAFVFVALVYGPFYGPTFSRMRSLFNYEEDASMGVRDGKRVRLQPYARENPFGGGLNTAGNVGLRYEPNHPMAGQFDPDSGYLRMALERGWIGLIINFTLYTLVLIYGIHNYHRSNDKEVKIYYAAYMAAYFALTIAHFTQDAMDQKPVVVVIMSSYAIFVRLIEIEKIKQKKIPSI